MNYTIICVGKLKEKYWTQACQEYSKRLSRFGSLSILELPDEKCRDTLSPKETEAVKEKEGEKILRKIPKNAYVIAMDPHGKQISSESMAKQIDQLSISGTSHLCFIIGGSLGLSDKVKETASQELSFSLLTFPHQLFRVMLLEQLYRCCKINANETYHK